MRERVRESLRVVNGRCDRGDWQEGLSVFGITFYLVDVVLFTARSRAVTWRGFVDALHSREHAAGRRSGLGCLPDQEPMLFRSCGPLCGLMLLIAQHSTEVSLQRQLHGG